MRDSARTDGLGRSRTAARPHVRMNTLRCRIRRIEALTGRNLGTLEGRAGFFLALRAARPASTL
ncbi:helix-turn-helix domain-containing protein [Actinomadura welshii]